MADDDDKIQSLVLNHAIIFLRSFSTYKNEDVVRRKLMTNNHSGVPEILLFLGILYILFVDNH